MLLMLSLGFMGSLHCIGMCGGLITAVSMGRPTICHADLFIYQIGRITSYAALGLLVGMGGVALHSLGGDLLQRMLTVIAGTIMITFALNLVGWLPDPLRRFTHWASQTSGLAQLARHAAKQGRPGSWYRLGIANGLLPCGLVYAALSLALAADSAYSAMLMMAIFGLGTIPAMMLVPTLLHKISPLLRSRSMKVAALLIIVMGAITILRSGVTPAIVG
ncbi:MAG: sulfite exporter TauE/SafE family protein [Mariprofundales bacterium]